MGAADTSSVASQQDRRRRLDLRSPMTWVLLALIGLTGVLAAISLIHDVGAWRVGHVRSHEPPPVFTGHLSLAITGGLFAASLWFRAKRSPRNWIWRAGAVLVGTPALAMLLMAGVSFFILVAPGQ